MGGSPFYTTSPFDPFSLRPASPPSHPRRPRSVISIPVSHPSPPSIPPSSAATIIQSRYRGFAVRRRTPLPHLRTIASVQLQLDRLHSALQRPDFARTVRENESEKLKLSESIMALLLRLDAIEGAIPEIRSRRKETTRKAIQLQETIDDLLLQEGEQEPELGENFDAECKKLDAEIPSGSSIDVVDSEKACNSPTCDRHTDGKMQETDPECQNMKTQSMEFSTADKSNSEENRRPFLQLNSELPAGSADCQGRHEKMIEEGCSIEEGKKGVNDPGKCSFSVIRRDDAGDRDPNEGIVYLQAAERLPEKYTSCCAGEDPNENINCRYPRTEESSVDAGFARGEKLENPATTDAANAEMSSSSQAIADTHVSSPLPAEVYNEQSAISPDVRGKQLPDKIVRADAEFECQIEDPSRLPTEAYNEQSAISPDVREKQLPDKIVRADTEFECRIEDREAVSWAISTQKGTVESDNASKISDVEAKKFLPSHSWENCSTREEKPPVSERELLNQLSEDSKDMKSILAKLYIQSRMQNKMIFSLNKRVSKLEHLVHRQTIKNRKHASNKHAFRK